MIKCILQAIVILEFKMTESCNTLQVNQTAVRGRDPGARCNSLGYLAEKHRSTVVMDDSHNTLLTTRSKGIDPQVSVDHFAC